MDYIKLPQNNEIEAIEYLAKKFYLAHLSGLQSLTFENLLQLCCSMAYEPDLVVNQVLIPSLVFSGEYGVNCKDFALIGIMWCFAHRKNYEIVTPTNHVYLIIDGQIFDPVQILTGE